MRGGGQGNYLGGSGPVLLATSSASSQAERVLQGGTRVETGHKEEGEMLGERLWSHETGHGPPIAQRWPARQGACCCD